MDLAVEGVLISHREDLEFNRRTYEKVKLNGKEREEEKIIPTFVREFGKSVRFEREIREAKWFNIEKR